MSTIREWYLITDWLSDYLQKWIDISKLQYLLPWAALITIYKLFVYLHLCYGDILHEQAFQAKLESHQYNAVLAITGSTEATPKENFCQKLSLEFLCSGPWFRETG